MSRRNRRRKMVLASALFFVGICFLVDDYATIPERVCTQTSKGNVVQIVSGV